MFRTKSQAVVTAEPGQPSEAIGPEHDAPAQSRHRLPRPGRRGVAARHAALDQLATARRKAEPALTQAREQLDEARHQLELARHEILDARTAATPHLSQAKDTLTDQVYPHLAAGVAGLAAGAAAAGKPNPRRTRRAARQAAAAGKRAAARMAVLEKSVVRKRSASKGFLLLGAIIASIAAAFAVKKRQPSKGDPWARSTGAPTPAPIAPRDVSEEAAASAAAAAPVTLTEPAVTQIELAPSGSGGVLPLPDGSAPAGYSIKGNADSGIYHVPGGRAYDMTDAEVWFTSPQEAEAAGFRPAKF